MVGPWISLIKAAPAGPARRQAEAEKRPPSKRRGTRREEQPLGEEPQERGSEDERRHLDLRV